MKKAKLVLSAVAVFAVIGGAFAFKARTLHTFYKVDTANPNPAARLCTLPVQINYTTLTQPGQAPIAQTLYYTTSVASTSCPTTTIFTVN